jgi:nucleoid-associated protein YgaU
MGVWNFVKEAGERIVENAKAAARFGPADKPAASAPAPSSLGKTSGGKTNGKGAGEAIADDIRAQNLEVSELKVSFEATTSTVQVSGTAKDQATREKVILCCGNIAGVEKVVDNLAVKEASPPAQFHTVAKGDTLSAIAKKYYGDPNKYPEIFEANKPMLQHPDKIYPGQSLRILEPVRTFGGGILLSSA